MTRFAVFATQRSGTGLLSSIVSKHPDVHLYGEVFLDQGYRAQTNFHNYFMEKLREDPANILLKRRKTLMKNFLRKIMDREEGVVGINIKYDQIPHFPMLLDVLKETDFKVVHLVRGNMLKTHISSLLNHMAGKLGRSAHGTKEVEAHKISVDPAGAANALERRFEEIKTFSIVLEGNFPYLRVLFEDFFDNGEKSVSTISPRVLRSLFEFLGAPYDESMELATEYKKTNPSSLRDVVANYEELCAALGNSRWSSLLQD